MNKSTFRSFIHNEILIIISVFLIASGSIVMHNGSATAKSSAEGAEIKEDFYKVLGVEKTATESQIKNAYRKLALKHHPDRNPGDHEAQEQFKKVSIAYAVLSDPNKRRQYDLSGPSGAILDFEGIDISEMGGVGRVFGALFSKLGVPIPTQIVPRVLGQARDLSEGKTTDVVAKELRPGQVIDGCIAKQEPAFFKIRIDPEQSENGVLLICRSTSMSKFKLVLFDKEGGVRKIEESARRKHHTSAELYFVPFDRANMSELIPLKFYMDDKEVPVEFHLLDGLEPSGATKLEPREHLICVYGDNWIKDVKYQLRFFPAAVGVDPIKTIIEHEKLLLAKKAEMSKFQEEYVEAKKRYDEAVKKLKSDTELILESIKARDEAYEQFIDLSASPFKTAEVATTQKGFLSSFFG
uniref:J domain-containing protein n=1 Tax=Plectus sambesii TaxID=2011161 RepID=A0A914XR76_9BILA